jgi:5-hydroxyisourate hydrolase
MGKITTHVLNTSCGIPAVGVRIRLIHADQILADAITNSDGRCESALATSVKPGDYQLIFSIGDYFRSQGIDSPFFNEIPIHFTVEAGRDYHVPLACSPYAYSTYRGS